MNQEKAEKEPVTTDSIRAFIGAEKARAEKVRAENARKGITGTASTSHHAAIWLVTPEETLVLGFDCGDLRAGMLASEPSISFSELVVHESTPAVTAFARRHGTFDLRYTVLGDLTGHPDRSLVVHECRVEGIEYVERDDGNRLKYRLRGRSMTGDLRDHLLGLTPVPAAP